MAAKVDRQTTTPFLLRLFFKQGVFHRLDEFDPSLPRLPRHLDIYTWETCTLRELCSLTLTAMPDLLPSPYAGTRIAFRLIYADTQGPSRPGQPGRFIARDLGSVVVGAPGYGDEEQVDAAGDANGALAVNEALKQLDGDPDRTLADARFVIGDYVACAILPPGPDGSVQPAPPPPGGPPRGPAPSFGGRDRENGFGARGGDYGYPRGGSRGRYDDRRPSGGLPMGEWRRGEAPPEREPGYGRGGGGGGGWGGRGRGRGRW